MNTSEILQLIQTLKDTGFKHIDVSHEGSHVLLSNAEYAGATMGSNPHYAVPVHNQHSFSEGGHHQSQASTAPSHVAKVSSETVAETSQKEASQDLASSKEISPENVVAKDLGGHLVESPIVGTFYAASGPDVDNFVSVGSKVKKGDVLCIIEAMKLMNEIEADVNGEIAEILVQNEEGVEYGQPLFRIV